MENEAYWETDLVSLYHGHVLDVLRGLPAESVQCVATSPPYWGLRNYDLPPVAWGGVDGCAHEWEDHQHYSGGGQPSEKVRWQHTGAGPSGHPKVTTGFCRHCNAWRGSLGLEPTPELFIEHIVEVFREVRRVLRSDGVLWLNLGDSYAAQEGGKAAGQYDGIGHTNSERAAGTCDERPRTPPPGLKPKDLCGIPWRVALALQQPYEKPHCIKHEIDRAWLAAFMDGEGCISIRQHVGRSNAKGHPVCQPGFVPFLCATNNDIELLDKCYAITKRGRVALKQSAGSTDNRQIVSRRDSYGWRVESNHCIDIICDIYPHLIAKRKQAVLAYNLALSNRNGKALRGNKKLPQREQEKRVLLKRLINACNQRESVDVPSWCVAPTVQVEPGWWLRSALPWVKRAAMPESASDRPNSALEYVFLLTKASRYFFDMEAVKVGLADCNAQRTTAHYDTTGRGPKDGGNAGLDGLAAKMRDGSHNGRHWRNGDLWFESIQPPHGLVWCDNEMVGLDVNPQGYKGAHFATFPVKLVLPMVRAGTSERGCCPACGTAWVRVVEKGEPCPKEDWNMKFGEDTEGRYATRPKTSGLLHAKWKAAHPDTTLGWRPGCKCAGVELIGRQPRKPSKRSGETRGERKAKRRAWKGRMQVWQRKWERLKRVYDGLVRSGPGFYRLRNGVPEAIIDELRSLGYDL